MVLKETRFGGFFFAWVFIGPEPATARLRSVTG